MYRDTFLIYTNFYKPLSYLSDEQLGRLFKKLFQYNLGREPEIETDIRIAYEFIINQFEIDEQKRQERIAKNIENGRKGGEAFSKNKAKQSETEQSRATVSETEQSRATVSETEQSRAYNENENENDKLKETPNGVKKSAVRFSPPTAEEVGAYIAEKGYAFTAEAFCDFYESKGWMVGRNKMSDWKAAVRNWQRGETERRCRNGTDNKPTAADRAADAASVIARLAAKERGTGE